MKNRQAFTLVELLVVLFLIMLLISILLPSLTRAREQANTVVCMSHMRQIIISQLNYAYDNKGVFGDPPSTWNVWVDDPKQPQFMYYMEGSGIGIIRYDVGTLWPYIASGDNKAKPKSMYGDNSTYSRYLQRIMTCPSDTEEIKNAALGGNGVGGAGNHWVRRNYTYSWNVLISYSVGGLEVCKRLNQFHNTAGKVILVEEAAPNDGVAWIAIDDMDDTPSWVHLGRGNWGFADGHVESLYPSDVGYTNTYTQLGRAVVNPDPKLGIRRANLFDLAK